MQLNLQTEICLLLDLHEAKLLRIVTTDVDYLIKTCGIIQIIQIIDISISCDAIGLFLYPLWFSDVSRGYRKRPAV